MKINRFLKNKAFYLTLFILPIYIIFFNFHKNDFEDAFSNEILFSKASLFSIFFEMKWKDQSPLYFVWLKLWGLIFSDDHLLTRIHYLIFAGITNIFLYKITQQITKNKVVSLFSVLIFTFSPVNSLWFYAGRMYPLFVFFTVILFYYTNAFIKKGEVKNLFIIIIIAILFIYLHFLSLWPVGLSIFLLYITNIYKKNLNNIKLITLSSILLIISTFPQLIRIYHYVFLSNSSTNSFSVKGSFIDIVYNVLYKILLNPYSITISEPILKIFFYMLLIFTIMGIIKIKRKDSYYFTLGIFWIIISDVIFSIASLKLDIRYRHFYFILPGIYIFFSYGLYSCFKKKIFFYILAPTFILISLLQIYQSTKFNFRQTSLVINNVLKLLKDEKKIVINVGPGYYKSVPELILLKKNYKEKNIEIRSKGQKFNEEKFKNNFNNQTPIVNLQLGQKDKFKKELIKRGCKIAKIWGNNINATICTKNKIDILKDIKTLSCADDECVYKAIKKRIFLENKEKDYKKNIGNCVTDYEIFIADKTFIGKALFLRDPYQEKKSIWQYGNHPWETSSIKTFENYKISKELINIHPVKHKKVIVNFGKIRLKSFIELEHAIYPKTMMNLYDSKPVNINIFANQKQIAKVAVLKSGKINKTLVPLNNMKNNNVNLFFTVEGENINGASLGFKIRNISNVKNKKIDLKKQLLSENIKNINFKIIKNEKEILMPAFYQAKYRAQDLHETPIASKQYALENRIPIGNKLWQSVGKSTVLIGNKPFEGIWVHPDQEYKLILKIKDFESSVKLKLFAGFSDIAVKISKERNINEPVHLKLKLNNSIIIEKDYFRNFGLNHNIINIPNKKDNELTLEFTTKNSTWSHFFVNLKSVI